MVRYLVLAVWFLAILLLGVVESAVLVPLVSIGLLLFTVKNFRWWLRLASLVLAGIVWGTAQAISPTLMVGLLFVGVWTQRWLALTVHQRSSNFYPTILVALLVAIARGVVLTPGVILVTIGQAGIFWICTRWLITSRPQPLQFFLPPATTHVKTAR